MGRPDLLMPTDRGLHCPEGGFHVDPWRPVERAVVTHAHGDHVARGCGSYLCSASGVAVLRSRLTGEPAPGEPPSGPVTGIPFGEATTMGGVRVSLHPAGHILGSAQVRVERAAANARRGEVWVVSGDYKTIADRTCEPFAPVPCDVFITESTFGLPVYRWEPQEQVFSEINAWWGANAAQDRTSIIFAYALGKAQRVLAGVDPSLGPIAVHGAVHRMNEVYRAAGITLPDAPHADEQGAKAVRGRGLVVAPPSALGSPWVRKFAASGGGMSAAFVSGWMRVRGTRRRKAIDRGFVLSDHADWPGLLGAIKATGASRVGVTHGYVAPMVRWLRETGVDAFAVPTRYTGETGEESEADPGRSPPPGRGLSGPGAGATPAPQEDTGRMPVPPP